MIEPLNGYLNGSRINQLKSVKYGMIPIGYKQVIPPDGHPSEPLVPGNRYMLRIETLDAVGFGGWFMVKDGGGEFVNLKGPCFHDERGRWKRVNCTD